MQRIRSVASTLQPDTARAVERWEDEGGKITPGRNETEESICALVRHVAAGQRRLL